MWRVLKIWLGAWLVAACLHTAISTGAVLAFGPYSDATTLVSMAAGLMIVLATFVWLFRRYCQLWRARVAI